MSLTKKELNGFLQLMKDAGAEFGESNVKLDEQLDFYLKKIGSTSSTIVDLAEIQLQLNNKADQTAIDDLINVYATKGELNLVEGKIPLGKTLVNVEREQDNSLKLTFNDNTTENVKASNDLKIRTNGLGVVTNDELSIPKNVELERYVEITDTAENIVSSRGGVPTATQKIDINPLKNIKNSHFGIVLAGTQLISKIAVGYNKIIAFQQADVRVKLEVINVGGTVVETVFNTMPMFANNLGNVVVHGLLYTLAQPLLLEAGNTLRVSATNITRPNEDGLFFTEVQFHPNNHSTASWSAEKVYHYLWAKGVLKNYNVWTNTDDDLVPYEYAVNVDDVTDQPDITAGIPATWKKVTGCVEVPNLYINGELNVVAELRSLVIPTGYNAIAAAGKGATDGGAYIFTVNVTPAFDITDAASLKIAVDTNKVTLNGALSDAVINDDTIILVTTMVDIVKNSQWYELTVDDGVQTKSIYYRNSIGVILKK